MYCRPLVLEKKYLKLKTCMAFDFTISSRVLSHIGKAYSAKLSCNSEPKFIIDHNTCFE